MTRILISSRLIEFWCFGLPVALGSRQVGGGCLGAWGVSPHACTCMCMPTHAHTHTCIKLQMAANMEASMFSMFRMFNMHVLVCVHACACVCAWDTPHIPIPTPICHPPRGWIPGISKNLIMLELIKIFQFRLKI